MGWERGVLIHLIGLKMEILHANKALHTFKKGKPNQFSAKEINNIKIKTLRKAVVCTI